MSEIFQIFRKIILRPDEIVEIALQNVAPSSCTTDYIKNNFSRLVESIQIDAYEEYLKNEKVCGKTAIKEFLKSHLESTKKSSDPIELIASNFTELDRFFLSLTQSRRSRAGSAFEDIIKNLFKRLSYQFDEQIVINGAPDFLMPSEAHYKTNAMDCIIFTAKRTLRERWRQIVTEGTRGLGFYLATIDAKVSQPQLGEMKSNRIYLVVPESLKTTIPHYSSAPNVISFEDFFDNHLDPAVKRWKRAKVIK